MHLQATGSTRRRGSSRRGLSRRPATRLRWLVAGLLVVFALAQGLALSHAAGTAHDHDGACTACRLVGEHASAIAPALSLASAYAADAEVAPTAPLLGATARQARGPAPRAPPSA